MKDTLLNKNTEQPEAESGSSAPTCSAHGELSDCPRCGSKNVNSVKLADVCFAVICEECGRQTQQYMAEYSAFVAWNNQHELRF